MCQVDSGNNDKIRVERNIVILNKDTRISMVVHTCELLFGILRSEHCEFEVNLLGRYRKYGCLNVTGSFRYIYLHP